METTAARFSAKDMAYIAVFTACWRCAPGSPFPCPGAWPTPSRPWGCFWRWAFWGESGGPWRWWSTCCWGAMGVPVFSGFQGGTAALLGTTGGYIAGFLFSALVMWMLEKLLGRSLPALA